MIRYMIVAICALIALAVTNHADSKESHVHDANCVHLID